MKDGLTSWVTSSFSGCTLLHGVRSLIPEAVGQVVMYEDVGLLPAGWQAPCSPEYGPGDWMQAYIQRWIESDMTRHDSRSVCEHLDFCFFLCPFCCLTTNRWYHWRLSRMTFALQLRLVLRITACSTVRRRTSYLSIFVHTDFQLHVESFGFITNGSHRCHKKAVNY
jgi:hypothetical protein